MTQIGQFIRTQSGYSGRLTALGIPHAWNAYGGGTHSWPYWQRDLRTWLPDFLASAPSG